MKQAHIAVRTAVAVALLSSLAGPALAVTQANLSLSGFSYRLKDLNAADGLTPALSWGTDPSPSVFIEDDRQSGWTASDTNYLTSDWEQVGFYSQSSSSAPVNLSSPSGRAWGSASVDGDLPGLLSIGANLSAGFGISAAANSYHLLTVSANTQVTLSFDLNGSLAGSGNTTGWMGSWDEGYPLDDRSSLLYYSASLNMIGDYGGTSFVATEGVADSRWWNGPMPYEFVIDGQRLQVTFSNKTAVDQRYQLSVDLTLHGREFAAPVPEPATYALMVAGLIAISGAAKRRRR